jgi:copper transport protein
MWSPLTRERLQALVELARSGLLAGFLAVLVAPTPVSAHAEVLRARPGMGEQLLTAPREVIVDYTEGVQLIQTAVVDSEGRRVDGAPGRVRPDARTIVEIPLTEGLADGIYTVRWQALADDGHTTRGAFFFVVGPEPLTRDRVLRLLAESGTAEVGSVGPLEASGRGLLFLALMVLVGVPVVVAVVIGPVARIQRGEQTASQKAMRRLLAAAAMVLLLAATLIALSQAASQRTDLSMASLVTFATTTLGQACLARLALGVGLLVVLGLVNEPRLWMLTAMIAGVLGQLTLSVTSHTASSIQGIGAVATDLGHLIGGALWGGGLVGLALLVPIALRGLDPPGAVSSASAVIQRFSALAIAGLGLAVAPGLLLAAWHVPSPTALLATLYGAVLGTKTVLVLLAVGLGGLNRLVILRRIAGPARPGAPAMGNAAAVPAFVAAVRGELLLVIAILFLSGVLTSVATANVAATQQVAREPLMLREVVRDIEVRLTMRPNQVGLNVFDVTFHREGRRIDQVTDVALLLRLPAEELQLPQLRLEPIEPGGFSGLGSFTLPGQWQLRVSGDVEGRFTARSFEVPVAAEKTAPVDEPFHGGLRMAAGVVGLLASGIVLIELVRRRGTGQSGETAVAGSGP